MKGTPATAARPAASAALLAALLLATTACSSSPSGPTAAQAGKDLQADLQAAVKGYMAQNELTPPFTVTSDGSKDISCGKGKARRVYTTMQRRTGKGVTDPGFMLGEVESLAGFLDQSKVYVPGSRTEKDQGPVTVSEKATSSRHHARALITGKADSGAFVLVLESTTDCLRTS